LFFVLAQTVVILPRHSGESRNPVRFPRPEWLPMIDWTAVMFAVPMEIIKRSDAGKFVVLPKLKEPSLGWFFPNALIATTRLSSSVRGHDSIRHSPSASQTSC
jgi:hypothetical protein